MGGWSHLRGMRRTPEELSGEDLSGRLPPKPSETLFTACKVGLIGGFLIIPATCISIALALFLTPSKSEEEQTREVAFFQIISDEAFYALVLFFVSLPIIWGLAFLATHILFLRKMHQSISSSTFSVANFACLAFFVSVLLGTGELLIFNSIIMGAKEPVIVSGFEFIHAAMMVSLYLLTGFVITVIGLAIWMIWRRLRSGGRAS